MLLHVAASVCWSAAAAVHGYSRSISRVDTAIVIVRLAEPDVRCCCNHFC